MTQVTRVYVVLVEKYQTQKDDIDRDFSGEGEIDLAEDFTREGVSLDATEARDENQN